ncbi:hypothetical protein [Roseicyclus mahoneyensis]|uniref:DKNYY family protein n=1 Tax=Roseicyclus mahoneyensis TaxID=164332 RepID=A0A316GGM0_9RHOB|nr:hypothetical protein [Roseicyclus mahoneyensis]PWK59295.1 hypothetical protein C7455_10862 [Roseicyclus mahoneyensis]
MAEPEGLLLEADLSEAGLAAWFRRKILTAEGKVTVGRALCLVLDGGEPADIVIVHHDPAKGRLFFAWILNHYADGALAPVWPLMAALASVLDRESRALGAVASTFPLPREGVRLSGGAVDRFAPDKVAPELLTGLSDRLWGFARKGVFPDAAGSMAARGMQCKPFRAAWKSYRAWCDEVEKPARIAAATSEAPFRLFDDIFTAEGAVFRRDGFSGRDIPFPGADPLSFRIEAGFHADRTQVWDRRLASGSPPAVVRQGGFVVNNRAAIWNHVPVVGAEGASFRWLFDRWDTIYWADRTRVYAREVGGMLVVLPGADAKRFRALGPCFGTDGAGVFFGARRLPLDPAGVRSEGLFLWDDDKVFFRDQELPLKGAEFRILGQKRSEHSRQTCYRLSDGAQGLVLELSGQILPDDPAF